MHVIVVIEYTTEADGTPVADDVAAEDLPRTLHGPFETHEQADAWIYEQPDDTDVHDYYTKEYESIEGLVLNDPKDRQ